MWIYFIKLPKTDKKQLQTKQSQYLAADNSINKRKIKQWTPKGNVCMPVIFSMRVIYLLRQKKTCSNILQQNRCILCLQHNFGLLLLMVIKVPYLRVNALSIKEYDLNQRAPVPMFYSFYVYKFTLIYTNHSFHFNTCPHMYRKPTMYYGMLRKI